MTKDGLDFNVVENLFITDEGFQNCCNSGSQPVYTYSWGKKDSTLHRAYGVKLPLLRAVWAGQGLILSLEKRIHFFLGP